MEFLKRKKLVGKSAKAREVTTNSGEGKRRVYLRSRCPH
jgi:hypothetical protein